MDDYMLEPMPDNDPPAPGDDTALIESLNRTEAKRCFSRLGMGAFVILGVATLLQAAMSIAFMYSEPAWLSEPWSIWILSFVPLYLVAIPLGLLVMRSVPRFPAESRPFGVGNYLTLLPVCIFLMYAGNFIGTAFTTLLGNLKGGEVTNPLEEFAMGDSSLVWKLLFLVVLAPLIEEFVFRRVLIDRMRVYGEKTAVIVSALIFGLFHGNLSQFFYAFALGIVFGYVYVKTGALRYSASLHMLINFIGSILGPALLERGDIDLDRLSSLDASTLTSNPELLGEIITPGFLLFLLYALILFVLSILGLVLLCVNAGRVSFSPAERELPQDRRPGVIWGNAGMILFLVLSLAMIVLSVLM
ncbi:MAG: CPBP family intramembrane metalloprotease [Oscillospiraceae bacterium]|nr:CPBP family intramembrane metalloprotease [Oscillospiraceae bacterium]